MHAYARSRAQNHVQTNAEAHGNQCACTLTCTSAYMVCLHACQSTRTGAGMNTQVQARTSTSTLAHSHAYSHTYTHVLKMTTCMSPLQVCKQVCPCQHGLPLHLRPHMDSYALHPVSTDPSCHACLGINQSAKEPSLRSTLILTSSHLKCHARLRSETLPIALFGDTRSMSSTPRVALAPPQVWHDGLLKGRVV